MLVKSKNQSKRLTYFGIFVFSALTLGLLTVGVQPRSGMASGLFRCCHSAI